MCQYHGGSIWEPPSVYTCPEFDERLAKIMQEHGNEGEATQDEETEAFRLTHPLSYAGINTREDYDDG